MRNSGFSFHIHTANTKNVGKLWQRITIERLFTLTKDPIVVPQRSRKSVI